MVQRKAKLVGAAPDHDKRFGLLADLGQKLKSDRGGTWTSATEHFLKTKPGRFRWGDTKDSLFVEQCDKWQERWKKHFSGLWIPEHRDGFDRLLVIPQGMRPNAAYDRLVVVPMLTWRCTDNLDTIFSTRLAYTDYAIWVRNQQEADEEWKEKSASDALAALVNGITLEERLVFEDDWFVEKKTHLDVKNVTLCAGSRDPLGSVPRVRWHDGKVGVNYYSADDAHVRLRLREVVS